MAQHVADEHRGSRLGDYLLDLAPGGHRRGQWLFHKHRSAFPARSRNLLGMELIGDCHDKAVKIAVEELVERVCP